MSDSAENSVDFPDVLQLTPRGTKLVLDFRTTKQVRDWSEIQLASWKSIEPAAAYKATGIAQTARQLVDTYSSIITNCKELEKRFVESGSWDPKFFDLGQTLSRLREKLNGISQGETECTEGRVSAKALALLPDQPVAAATWLWLNRPTTRSKLGEIVQGSSWVDVLLAMFELRDVDSSSAEVRTVKDGIDTLRNEGQKELVAMRVARSSEQKYDEEFRSGREVERLRYEAAALEQRGAIAEEWSNLKRLYDTDLALRAPTTYWSAKQNRHRWFSIAYGMAFGAMIAVGLWTFAAYGVEILSKASDDAAKSASIVPRLVEIGVPAFLGIWLLRIVGRMLSTHLQLLEEAGERATMVKTFLALMKDEERGSLVRDEDRILILSALFRHSSTSGTDDAPPASWFDLLMTRLKKEKG